MKTKLIIVITLLFMIFARPTPTYAVANAAWGLLDIIGDTYAVALTEIYEQIKEGIMSAAKMAAIQQATSTIDSLLYDGSSSPRNISNYYDFMLGKPADEAVTYTESFLTEAMRGTSSSDYSSNGGNSELINTLQTAGQNIIDAKTTKEVATINMSECSGDSFFSNGDFKCFNQIMSNSMNIPVGMAMAVDGAYQKKYDTEAFIQEKYATTTGVLPSIDENGNIKLPSSVVLEIQNQQVKLPLAALASGDSGIFATAVQSVAVGIIMKIVTEGITEVTQQANDATAS